MRIASIDIGSNTSLLLIVEQTKTGFEVLCDEIYFTRLAEDIEKNAEIKASALSRLEQAFSSMRNHLNQWQVERLSIVATSASRQAKNKDCLYALGRKYQLEPIKIISPKREAELTFIGALFGLGQEASQPLVVDIGGGSTEFVSTEKSYSLNIGSVFLTENFLNEKALSKTDRLALLESIGNELKTVENFLNKDYETLIFVAGTPVTLAFLEKQTLDPNDIHGLLLKEKQVSFWLEKLMVLSVEERKKIPYLPEHRADVIISGLSLLQEILKRTKKKEFLVSATGVRYGLILEQIR